MLKKLLFFAVLLGVLSLNLAAAEERQKFNQIFRDIPLEPNQEEDPQVESWGDWSSRQIVEGYSNGFLGFFAKLYNGGADVLFTMYDVRNIAWEWYNKGYKIKNPASHYQYCTTLIKNRDELKFILDGMLKGIDISIKTTTQTVDTELAKKMQECLINKCSGGNGCGKCQKDIFDTLVEPLNIYQADEAKRNMNLLSTRLMISILKYEINAYRKRTNNWEDALWNHHVAVHGLADKQVGEN